MGAAQLGYLFGAFLVPLALASVWLIFCKIVPGLRRDVSTTYWIAIGLALVPTLTSSAQTLIYNVIGGGLCVALLAWQMRRAKRKLRATTQQS